MGCRANVCIKGEAVGNRPVFFYTHWKGDLLPKIVATAIERGRPRWGDTAYLARIIFCDLIAGSERELTGFGISTCVQDNNYDILVVDDDAKTVGLAREKSPTRPYKTTTYAEFIADPAAFAWGDDT